MRVLVTGSNGLLGSKLIEVLSRSREWQPIGSSRGECTNTALGDFPFYRMDVTDAEQVRSVLAAAQPDAVVHTAAMTDVDGCERAPVAAWALNVDGTLHVARACGAARIPLVHLSTEYVFDGRAGPYTEADPPHPISVYGRTKLESERMVATYCSDWSIARTTVLFGQAPGVRSNFVLWLIERLRAGERVRIVADQIGSPTLADNLAEMVLALLDRRAQGVYHTVGATRIERYAFARMAAEAFGLEAELIEPIQTAELRQPAPRPLRAGLSTWRFQQQFPHVPVLTAREALQTLRAQLTATRP